MRFKKEIEEGIKLLDETMPDWRSRIDPQFLEMHNCEACILGQLYHHYDNGIDTLFGYRGFSDGSGETYGFEITSDAAQLIGSVSAYDLLTEEWLEALGVRYDEEST